MQSRTIWPLPLILIFAVALQSTWLAHFTLAGGHIDLPLLTVVSVALELGWEVGLCYGMTAGIATGIVSDYHLGSFLVSRGAPGGICGLFDTLMSRDNPLAPVLAAAGATVLSNFVYAAMSPTDYGPWWWLKHTLAIAAVHAILVWPVHWCIRRLVAPVSLATYSLRP